MIHQTPPNGTPTSSDQVLRFGDVVDEIERYHPGRIALACASMGWPVLPLRRATKRPALKRWPELATTSVETIQEWWSAAFVGCLCGVATGREAGIWVLDVDVKADNGVEALLALEARLGSLPRTFTVRTPSGGWHLYFTYPEDREVKTSGTTDRTPVEWRGLESRGWHGQVVAPGTAIGALKYEVVEDTEVAEAPDWLLDHFTRREREPWAGEVVDRSYDQGLLEWAEEELEREAAELAEVTQGRNTSLNLAAFRLGGLAAHALLAEEDVRRELHAACEVNGLLGEDGEGQWELTYRSGWDAGAAQPRWLPASRAELPEYTPLLAGTGPVVAAGLAPVVSLADWREGRPPEPPAVEEGGGDGGEPPDVEDDGEGGGDDGFIAGAATDRTNARELVALFGDRVLFNHQTGWHVWDGARWRVDDRHHIREVMELLIRTLEARRPQVLDPQVLDRRLRKLETIAGLQACLAYAEGFVSRTLAELDRQPRLLNCANGTLDLETGELRPHAQADLLTRVTGAPFVPDARSDLLDEYLATFMPDPEHQVALFRLLGLALLGGNEARLLLLLVGGTTSGKSQLASGLERALGDYVAIGNASIFRGNLDDKPRPDLLRLLSSRLALLEEAGQSWELHGDRIKHLTGGGTVSVRGMRSNNFVDRVPDFTPVIVANELPRVKGADEATKRRMTVVPFAHRPAVEDPAKKVAFLRDRGCHAALLARVVRGCVEAQVHGIADLPYAFELAKAEAFDALDDVAEFVKWSMAEGTLVHELELPAMQCVRTMELHAAYVRWITKHGDQVQRRDRLGPKNFSQRLHLMGWELIRSNGSRWAGYRLHDEYLYRP